MPELQNKQPAFSMNQKSFMTPYTILLAVCLVRPLLDCLKNADFRRMQWLFHFQNCLVTHACECFVQKDRRQNLEAGIDPVRSTHEITYFPFFPLSSPLPPFPAAFFPLPTFTMAHVCCIPFKVRMLPKSYVVLIRQGHREHRPVSHARSSPIR